MVHIHGKFGNTWSVMLPTYQLIGQLFYHPTQQYGPSSWENLVIMGQSWENLVLIGQSCYQPTKQYGPFGP